MTSQSFLDRKYTWNEHNVCTNPLVFDFGHDKKCHCRISLAEDEIYIRLGYDYGYCTDTTQHGSCGSLPSKGEHSHPYPSPLAAVTAGLRDAIEFFSEKPAAKFVASLRTQLKSIEQSMELPQPTQESIMPKTVIEAETKEQPVEYKCVDCGEIFTSPNDFAHKCAGDGEFSDDHEFVEVPCHKNLPQEETGIPETTTPPADAAARSASVFIPEPENLLPVKRTGKSVSTVEKQLTCQQIESAIQVQLDAEYEHTKASSVAALRAGVLFHLYKEQSKEQGREFYDKCGKKFFISQGTIFNKMRLAVIWAKENGADESTVMMLANACDLNDKSNTAVQLAFDFVGDNTITDLYRMHGITRKPRGGDVTPKDASGKPIRADRRPQAQIEYDAWKIAADARNARLKADIDNALAEPIPSPDGAIRCWQLLDTKSLKALAEAVDDFAIALAQTLNTRAVLAGKK